MDFHLEVKISQEEVLQVLEKHDKPLSCSEISQELCAKTPTDRFRINKAIKKLVEHREIRMLEIDRFEAKKRWGEHAPYRRVRLYYI